MNTKFIIGSIILLVALIGGGYYISSNVSSTAEVALDQQATAQVDKSFYDWGTVGINDGDVEAIFTITNGGVTPLKLLNAETSCGCTTAQLSYKEKESPLYGMHTTYDYVLEIPPKESAQLTVVYDPLFHGPDGTGSITRQAFVETNDPKNPKLEFELAGNVVD